MIAAALAGGADVRQVFYCQRAGAAAALAEQAAAKGTPVAAVDDRTMAALSETRTPQGIAAVVGFLDREVGALERLLPRGRRGFVLVLHDVSDPGNAGTLIRCAEAFSAAAVCFGPAGVEPYNGKLVRATAGAFFRVPIVCYEDWGPLKTALTNIDAQLVGAEASAQDVRDAKIPDRCALIVGHERHGLQAIPSADAAIRVSVPQAASAESLNAGVAGAIVMYEIARRLELIRRGGPASA